MPIFAVFEKYEMNVLLPTPVTPMTPITISFDLQTLRNLAIHPQDQPQTAPLREACTLGDLRMYHLHLPLDTVEGASWKPSGNETQAALRAASTTYHTLISTHCLVPRWAMFLFSSNAMMRVCV